MAGKEASELAASTRKEKDILYCHSKMMEVFLKPDSDRSICIPNSFHNNNLQPLYNQLCNTDELQLCTYNVLAYSSVTQ